jgi:WD40 repeat protein
MMRIFLFIAAIFIAELSFAQAPELVIPKGHAGDLSALAISPDKKWLASGDDKGTVKLWDMQTAKEVKTFDNNPELRLGYGITALAFSADSKKLYTGIYSTLLVYDLSNAGKEIFKKGIHEDLITQILFSANGKIFVTAADDEVKIWEADNLASPKIIAIKGKKPKLAFDDLNNIIVVTTGNYTQVSSSFDFTDIVTNKGYITHINTATGQGIVTDEFENLPADKIFISPNGKLLAITRYEKLIENNEEVSAGTVQLLDIASKKIIKKFTGIQDSSINILSFSNNSRYIATKAGKSFILYDLATLKFVKTFYSEDIFTNSILFSADDTKLLQGINSDGSVVQWNLKESNVEKIFGSQANFVKDLAVTPDQKSLVLLYGTSEYYGERFFLQKFDLNSTVLSKINSTGIAGSMQNFNIASAGGGRLFEPGTVNMIDAILSNQTVIAFSISNNNRTLVTTNQYESQPQLSFYNVEDGKKINSISLQSTAYSLLFSKDDKIIYVGYYGNNKIDKIEIKTGTILKTFEHIDSYSKDRKINQLLISKDENTLIGVNEFRKMYSWNTTTGVESEVRVSSETGGFSLKTVPNTNTFIYGDGIKNIEIYDLSANKIIRALTCNSRTIGALDITPDGKFIFYCNNDKSVSIWDLTKGALVATMVFFGEKDWVIVDKAGRFDGTQESIKKMYYVKGLDIIPLESNYEQFYTPSLLQRILEGENFTPQPVNINTLKDAPKVKIAAEQIKRNLTVEDDVAVFSSEKEHVNIKVQADCPNDGVTEIRLFQNGKLVETTRNLTVEDEKTSEKSSIKTFAVTLSPGENRFKAIAFNTERTESKPAELIVSYTALNIDAPVQAATTLHLIVVGINTYKNPKYNLNYALADATSFAEAITKGSKNLFTKTNTVFIKDADATKEGMVAAFNKIKATAKPQDLFVFYYAGHGVINDKKQFFLVPYDVTQLYGNDEALAQKGFSTVEMQQMSKDIKAQKQLFILDACQSAAALNDVVSSRGVAEEKAIAQLARATGTFWLTASSSDQFASEFSQLGHGSFTYCLLQAFKGDANPGDKKLTVKILDAYLQIKVPEITQKYKGTAQLPASYSFGNDFPIIIVQ